MNKTALQPDGLIPLSRAKGTIGFLATDVGLSFLPCCRIIRGKGDGGLYSVDVPVTDDATAAALRLCGVSAADIAFARQ